MKIAWKYLAWTTLNSCQGGINVGLGPQLFLQVFMKTSNQCIEYESQDKISTRIITHFNFLEKQLLWPKLISITNLMWAEN